MAVSWLIKLNAGTPATLASLGVTRCVLHLVANGADSLEWTVEEDYAADPAFPNASKVCLIRRDGATDVCWFVGWVESIPRQTAGGGPESISYRAGGPSARLARTEYAQQWKVITEDDGTAALAYEPRVILGENQAGTRRTTGGQIGDVVAFAAARGIPIVAGTVAAGLTAPLDEKENVTCWDAIIACLRWTPTHVLWWDYDHQEAGVYTPQANVTAAASMTAVDVALHGGIVTSAAFTPRYDLQVPGVVVTYRIAGTKDGKPYERRAYATAGDADAPERASVVVDLEGRSTETLTQKVVTGTYPADITADKAWLAGFVPWLADLPTDDWSIVSYTSDGAEVYPRYLVEGAVAGWMSGVGTERETISCVVAYVTRDAEGEVADQAEAVVPLTLISTNATTRTYSKTIAVGTSEGVPSGLAAALYAEWALLHWDGSCQIDEDECTLAVRPGRVVNWTGARTEWATMRAVVQGCDYDIAAGVTSVSVGPCARLEADGRMALWRAVRGRRRPVSRSQRDDGTVEAISGQDAFPKESVAEAPAHSRQRLRIAAEDADENLHAIDLHPAGTAFATAGDKTPTVIQPREFWVVYDDAGVKKAKLAQVLCSELYGDAATLGGAAASAPTYYKTLGSNTEGDEAAATDTWAVGDVDASTPPNPLGLWLWIQTRPGYYHAGDKKLYGYFRKLVVSTGGGFVSVSAETRVEIEAPEV
jgi:hypothetical protein